MKREEILKKIAIIITNHTKVKNITEETNLHSICDLVTQSHIEEDIEREFGISFAIGEIIESNDVADLIDIVEKHLLI